MIPELGQFCLVIALLASLLQGAATLAERAAKPHGLMFLTKPLSFIVFFALSGSFLALIYAYIMSDFTVLNVIQNSHSTKPLLYKVVGAWGNHEGSMLLWIWVLAACGCVVSLLPAADRGLKYAALSALGLIEAGFLAFVLFTSNPFVRVFPAPADGEDLNPILQDIGLAFHPPTLYVGYVGFGIVFAYAMAGLLRNRIDSDWAKTVHPWILLPWSFLTLGIGAGSWWAYRELGWGGWWFWDPVENVSLLPWLVGTALLHSNMVLEKRGQLGGWVVLLAILTFTLSLIGTFIVRSGLITSVHAFASDPARGIFILGYIGLVSGVALFIYSRNQLEKAAAPALLSRSGFILLNNLLLVAASVVVLVAILYPLMMELMGLPSISVGPPYFNATFLPITAGLPLLAALAPLMAWDKTSVPQLKMLALRLAPSLLVACVIVLAFFSVPSVLAVVGVALAAWLIYGTGNYIMRVRRSTLRWRSRAGLRCVATGLAHAGLACFIFGMVATSLLKQTYELPLRDTKPLMMGEYQLTPIAAERKTEDNFSVRRVVFEVSRAGRVVATLAPELRYYPVRGMQTTEAALHTTPLRDLYVVLGTSDYAAGKDAQSGLGVRMYVTPGQQWVWIGFMLVALGGFVALIASYRKEML